MSGAVCAASSIARSPHRSIVRSRSLALVPTAFAARRSCRRCRGGRRPRACRGTRRTGTVARPPGDRRPARGASRRTTGAKCLGPPADRTRVAQRRGRPGAGTSARPSRATLVPARGWRGSRPGCAGTRRIARRRAGRPRRIVMRAPGRTAGRSVRPARPRRATNDGSDAGGHLALLPGGFEAARVRKASGGKGRIGELPHEPGNLVIWSSGHLALAICQSMPDDQMTRCPIQNRKYRCASGSTVAGSERRTSPSAVTAYVSGSTVMTGSASFSFMSRLPSVRQPRTATSRLPTRYRLAMSCVERGLRDERERDRLRRAAERAEHRPHEHRLRRRNRRVRVAHLRPRDEAALDDHLRLDAEELRPPQHEVGELAGFDRSDLVRHAVRDRGVDRVLRDVAPDAHVVVVALLARASRPRWRLILSAVCHVRQMTSPTRPIAWLSLDIMLIAPRSCRTSSAAIVSPRMRLSANATSSAMFLSR